jgi:prevent-host-death family protein
MSTYDTRSAREARAQLAELLDAAERGRSTLITRRGRAVAEIVPVGTARPQEQSLLELEGSGRGLWGARTGHAASDVRDEWER